ncbi:MAG: penicillin-binding protein 2 [Candidatus Omnitrophota bacterium]
MRLKIIKILIWFFFVVIVLDLIYAQFLRGNYFYKLSTHNRIRVVPTEGTRGRILDRNGIVLADNRVSFDVMVTPQEIKKRDELFGFLSQVLQVDRNKLLDRFHQKKYAPFVPVIVAEDINRNQAFILEENKFRYPSLLIQKNYRRYYPYKKVGSHVLGYVGKIDRSKIEKLKDYGYSAQNIVGYSGVEEFYDQEIRGAEGGLQVEVNSQGQQVRLLGVREITQGKDIQLTIDNRVQLLAFEVLEDYAGSIIAMDAETGEILGLVSAPAYDPNSFADSERRKETLSLFMDPDSPLLNRAIKGQYPPGSVFKVPIAVSALETKALSPEETFLCNGFYQMGRRRIRCAHKHGTQSLIPAIAHSCNVYFINVGLRVESDTIARYARLLGLGRLTGIDIPFEETGSIPSRKQRKANYNRPWYKGDTANLSIGQGDVLVTPIQLVRMMAAVVNNGKSVQPHVFKGVNPEEDKKRFPARNLKIEKRTWELLQEGLYQVVHDLSGTAHIVNIEGMSVSGKTGTAQTSGGKRHHSWFAGYVIAGEKKIAFCVFLEHTGSSYYACRVARQFLLRLQKEGVL